MCVSTGRALEEGERHNDGAHNMMVITVHSTTSARLCLPKGAGRKHSPNVRSTCSGRTEMELAGREGGSTEAAGWRNGIISARTDKGSMFTYCMWLIKHAHISALLFFNADSVLCVLFRRALRSHFQSAIYLTKKSLRHRDGIK